ncbi:SAF domain-containing protein [Solwaraspora sp. WMMD406]|uniref:SAF domain-containing protein n=1 Tax=Solwaraspora sp. WMMD406 TaxID=3016095 RepID=UPI00241783E3|nr:SAF domain-containing protein [Solwaraspora sp. WMMD406]MDG4764469.1 SAF domain-containing protein [Solwaraspora sp. WMMD406]
MPFVALGGLLVIVCVLAYAYGAAQLGDRVQVLAVARPVAAGQAITAAHLTQVSAARESRVRLVPASNAVEVVGRTAVVPLVAGMLLTPEVLGDAAFPPGGQVTASVAVKPGQYPQGLAAGARVAVYVPASVQDDGQPDPAPTSAPTSAATPDRLAAVVLGVDLAGDGQGATVITLLLDASDAPVLAAAPAGAVVLMQTSPVEG